MLECANSCLWMCVWAAAELLNPCWWDHFSPMGGRTNSYMPVVRSGASFSMCWVQALPLDRDSTSLSQGWVSSGSALLWVGFGGSWGGDDYRPERAGASQVGPHMVKHIVCIPPKVTWAMDIHTDTSCFRTTDPDVVMGINLWLDVIMAPGGIAIHSYMYGPGGTMTHGHQHGFRCQLISQVSAQPSLENRSHWHPCRPWLKPDHVPRHSPWHQLWPSQHHGHWCRPPRS